MKLGAATTVFTENWGLKLLSLAFATLLWMYVIGGQSSEVTVTPPPSLELTRVPANMVIVSRPPEFIRIRLRGPRTLLAAINPKQLSYHLDLDGLRPGVTTYEILPRKLKIPRGVEITHLHPSSVTIEADLKVNKVVDVKPRTKGTPAKGFVLTETRCDPLRVEVEGPERAMKQLKELNTAAVDITDFDGSVTRPVELSMPDPSIRPIGPSSVNVEVVIKELRGEREFLKVAVASPDARFQVKPPAVDIKVEGPLLALSRLAGKDVTASLKLPEGVEDPAEPVAVAASAPQGIQIVSVNPEKVEVVRLPPPVEFLPALQEVPPGADGSAPQPGELPDGG